MSLPTQIFMKNLLYRLKLTLTVCFAQAGVEVSAQTDKSNTLNIRQFYEIIVDNHPVVKQANLLSEAAKQELLMARGQFDPKLGGSLTRKEYNNKSYYNLFDTQLKVPLWTGTDLKLGHERNSGVYLSDQWRTPEGGLNYAGITIPVGQGLLIDERRATLRQAQLFLKIAEAEQAKNINKILLSAAKDYWEWFNAYNNALLWEQAAKLAEIRFKGISDRIIVGENAPIDSVEARIIFQERTIALQQAQVALQNTRLQLSNYLWNSKGEPVEIAATLQPETFSIVQIPDTAALSNLRQEASTRHPELVKFDFKLKQLDIQRKLGREMLKPMLNVNYNLLRANSGEGENLSYNFMTNNYKVGIDFMFPLLLRKERGKLQLVKIKQQQTHWERMQANREIMNGIEAEYNELLNVSKILVQQQQMTNNYGRLRDAEVKKFEEGESSLFLINSRESKLIEAQLKLNSLQAKYRKAKATLQWAAGKNEFAEL